MAVSVVVKESSLTISAFPSDSERADHSSKTTQIFQFLLWEELQFFCHILSEENISFHSPIFFYIHKLFLIKRWSTVTVVSTIPWVRIACDFFIFLNIHSDFTGYLLCANSELSWEVRWLRDLGRVGPEYWTQEAFWRWWCCILSSNLTILTNQRRFSEWKIPMEWNPSAQISSWKQQTKKSWKWVHLPQYSFLWPALKIHHKCGGENNKDLFSYSSKIKLLTRLHSFHKL